MGINQRNKIKEMTSVEMNLLKRATMETKEANREEETAGKGKNVKIGNTKEEEK